MTAAQNTDVGRLTAFPVFHQAQAAPGQNMERCHCRNTIALPGLPFRKKEHYITASYIRY